MKYTLFNYKILLAVLLVGLMHCSVKAQQTPLPEPNGTFYGISVQDIDKAIDWYVNHLNFKLDFKGGNDQRQGTLLKRSGVILELAQFASAKHRHELSEALESHEVYGIFKIGFMINQLDETFKALESGGVDIFFPIVTASNGMRTFGIKDLEGNIIQFFGQ